MGFGDPSIRCPIPIEKDISRRIQPQTILAFYRGIKCVCPAQPIQGTVTGDRFKNVQGYEMHALESCR